MQIPIENRFSISKIKLCDKKKYEIFNENFHVEYENRSTFILYFTTATCNCWNLIWNKFKFKSEIESFFGRFYYGFFFSFAFKKIVFNNWIWSLVHRNHVCWFPSIRNFHWVLFFFEPVIRLTVREGAVKFHRTVRHVICERQSPFYVFFFFRWQCWGVLDVYCSNKFINKNIRQRCFTLVRPNEIECKLHLVSISIIVCLY